MFDLDAIEKDWQEHSFCLNEEDIIEIFRSEGATLNKYLAEINEYRQKTHVEIEISPEERLLANIFGDSEIQKKIENADQLREKLEKEFPFPVKKHLSKENQKRVVEGCLDMVFDSTREWYDFFNGNLSMEKIYYVCLEALMNSVKYAVHCEKPIFRLYISKSITRNIIKHIAKWEHLSYREVYEIVFNIINDDAFFFEKKNISCHYENIEESQKPSKIFHHLRNETDEFNYVNQVSSNEFMKDYNQVLSTLDDDSRMIMQLSFDQNGYRGLTSREIADYLGIDCERVSNIRRKAIKTLRKDPVLQGYLSKTI